MANSTVLIDRGILKLSVLFLWDFKVVFLQSIYLFNQSCQAWWNNIAIFSYIFEICREWQYMF